VRGGVRMKKILIIEDELSYLKLLREQLAKNGYEVTEAKDGKKGLAAAKLTHPDLILLDIRMPEMDGMTMLTELRKDEYGQLAKVIILTNLEPDDKILKTVLVDRPTYYLMKSDIQLSELIAKIKELIEV
jgi:CheY-like chemotaxis protein